MNMHQQQDRRWREIGERLALARRHAGYTQAEIARMIRCSVSTVRNWESGRVTPNIDGLAKLCVFIRCDINYLIEPLQPHYRLQRLFPDDHQRDAASHLLTLFSHLNPQSRACVLALAKSLRADQGD